MKIKHIIVGSFEVNCFIIWNEESRQAAVIDPGASASEIAACLRSEHLIVGHFLLTHGHVDHLSALADLADEFPAPIVLHPADAAWAFNATNQIEPFYPAPRRPSAPLIFPEGLCLQTAGADCRIIPTPGHSPGGVCYFFAMAKLLFSGDTLFQGTVGRTDLPGGDTRTLATSLQGLKTLPPATRLFPGHGAESTLAAELRVNPFLRES